MLPHILVFCRRPAALLMSLAALSSVAFAQADDDRATVRLDGRAVLRVSGTEEQDAAERAERVERRLARLLEAPQAIARARVEVDPDDPEQRIITVAGVPVVTVSEEDAQDNIAEIDGLARQWALAVDAALQRGRERRLSAWGRFAAAVRGSIETAIARLVESAITIIPRIIAALLVIAFFWGLAALVRRLMRAVFRRIVRDLTLENLLKQIAYYTVWIIGIIVALDAFGFDPATVVTGLGLTSLALGFALKDIISNFVSGLLILTLRPFELGDQIIIGDTEGRVERIELRATQIRTYDGRAVLVPNADLFTSRVINNTASPVRRGDVEVIVGYQTDLAAVSETIRNATSQTPGVLPDPSPSVRCDALSRDGVHLQSRFWTDSRRSDFVATRSAVAERIASSLQAEPGVLPEATLRVTLDGEPHRASPRRE